MKNELLIIDDDPIFRIIISKMINRTHPSLIINECENGEIGLSMLQQLSNSHEGIIVLLDINMPILDGWGFLKQIEEHKLYNLQKLMIYIVSSSTDEVDLTNTKEYTFVKGFFHKPLTRDDLNAIIDI